MQGEGRRADVKISYERKDVTKDVAPYQKSFEYSDIATGGSDEISLVVRNDDMRWLNKWKPLKGSTLSAKIMMHDWDKENISKSFKTGDMIMDDLTAEGSPANEFTMKAVSAPVKSEFKSTKRKKTYKNATLQTIAQKIAKRAGVSLHYEASKIKIKEIEQSNEPDADFLLSLCDDYGLGIKIYNKKIVIYDEEKYEKKDPLVTIYRTDRTASGKKVAGVESWEWNTTMQGTYAGCTVTYTDSSNNKKHKARAGKKKGRQLKLNVSAFSKKDAQLKAKAALRRENKKLTTMSLTMQADPRVIATGTVKVTGFGKANGKYFVDEVKHHIEGGYTIELTLHKIIQSKKKPQGGGGREDSDSGGGGGR